MPASLAHNGSGPHGSKKANTSETQLSAEKALPENQSMKDSRIVNSAERGTLSSTETTESVTGCLKCTTQPPVGPANGVGSFANSSASAPTASASGIGKNSNGKGVGGFAIPGALPPTGSTNRISGRSSYETSPPIGPANGVDRFTNSDALPPTNPTNGMGRQAPYEVFPPSGPGNGVIKYTNSGALPSIANGLE
jgi:hypothetical protein